MNNKKFWWLVVAVIVFLLEYEAFVAGILVLYNQPDDLLFGAAVVLTVIWIGAIIVSGAFFNRKIFPSLYSVSQEKTNNEK